MRWAPILALWSAAALVSPAWASAPGAAASPAPEEATAPSVEQPTDDGAHEYTLFVSGVYLTVLGGAALVSGLLYTTVGPVEYCPNCASTQSEVLGTVLLVGGFAATVAGSALVVIGASSDGGDEDDPDAPPSTPELALGPAGAALRWTF